MPTPTASSPTPTASPDGSASYVDCAAPDGGDGTQAHPWNTLAAVTAHGPFAPGDRLLLHRGTTCTGRLTPTGSGTNGAPIVLGAYGTGASPVVQGGGTPDRTGAVQLTDVHDWIVQDLTVTNFDPAGPDNTLRAGILIVNDAGGRLDRVTVRRDVVRNVTSSPGSYTADPHEYGGIVVLVRTAAAGAAFSNVRVEDDLVDHVGRTGIAVWSNAWPATPTTAVSVARDRVLAAEGDSILLWGVDGGVIEHSTSVDGGHLPACPRCTSTALNTASAGIWPVESRNIVLRYDEVSGEGAAGGDGEGFDIDEGTTDVILEGSYAHDNDGGGVLICGARNADVRYNVFADAGGGEITFSCPTQRDGVRIFNNTIHLGPGSEAQVVRHTNTRGSAPILFANNLVDVRNGGGYAWPSPVVADHNLFAGHHPASQPQDASASTADPLQVLGGADGTGLDSVLGEAITAGSPAAGSGMPMTSAGSGDYLGHPVDPAAPDRGAFARPGITTTPSAPTGFAATRSGADITLQWLADKGSVQRVERSIGDGPWTQVSGLLTSNAFQDTATPAGPLAYRLVTVGRDEETVVGAVAVPVAGATPAPS